MQLTTIENNRREKYESEIYDITENAYIGIGERLIKLRDEKLYREFGTFKEYCKIRFGYNERAVYQFINANVVISNLHKLRNCAVLPTSESQARPLTKLEPELQRQAWAEVIEENEPEAITAKIITAKVETKKELNEAVREIKRDNMPNTIFVQTPLSEKEILKKAKEIHEAKPKAHVSHNSGNNEWYTPSRFTESAKIVMGSIDLDPASSLIANKKVRAKKYYTKEQNGLAQKWAGNVWLNPPYAQPLINDFSLKILEEIANIKSIIILVNNATETKWLQRIMAKCSAMCMIKSRVKFLDPNGNPGAPLQGQVIVYIGDNINGFIGEFSKYGICLSRKVK